MTFIVGLTLFLLGIICWMVADEYERRDSQASAYSFLFLAGGLMVAAGYLFWMMVW